MRPASSRSSVTSSARSCLFDPKRIRKGASCPRKTQPMAATTSGRAQSRQFGVACATPHPGGPDLAAMRRKWELFGLVRPEDGKVRIRRLPMFVATLTAYIAVNVARNLPHGPGAHTPPRRPPARLRGGELLVDQLRDLAAVG